MCIYIYIYTHTCIERLAASSHNHNFEVTVVCCGNGLHQTVHYYLFVGMGCVNQCMSASNGACPQNIMLQEVGPAVHARYQDQGSEQLGKPFCLIVPEDGVRKGNPNNITSLSDSKVTFRFTYVRAYDDRA